MRTRNHARYNTSYSPVTGGYTNEYNTFYEEIIDVNNGALRPESPCDLIKCWTTPSQDGVLYENGSRQFLHWPAFSQASYFREAARQKLGDFEVTVNELVLRKQIGLNERFSSINFFLELGDVADLIKGLDRYRYIDYRFGIAPMISDMKDIKTHLDTSIAAVNRRLDAFAQPIPLTFTKTYHTGGSIPYPFVDSVMNFDIDVRCSFKGTFRAELPILSRYNRDYTLWLDQIGFHPDLATVWEAVPFSWLIDWFVPIGDSLEAMSGSWMNPSIIFTGSTHCTYNVSSTHTVSPRGYISSDLSLPVAGSFVDSSVATGYIRNPLSNVTLNSKRPKFTLGLGLDSLGKAALLSDIFGPTKAAEKSSLTPKNFRRGYETLKKALKR